jgi:hypothetical protein
MPHDLDRELFKIITHLVSSAPLSYEETPALAAFRMVDAAHRLMSLAENSDALADDEFLREAHRDYLAHFNLVMTDEKGFRDWLGEYVARFTKEAIRRTSAT